MRSKVARLAIFFVLSLVSVPVLRAWQGPPAGLPQQAKAEVTLPDRFDRMTVPVRDLLDRPVTTPARGGRDFEPGRPFDAGNTHPTGQDPLAAAGTGAAGTTAVPHVFTGGTGVDPNRRVAPPDTTGDLGLNHYVQWVNLRYAVYNVTRTNGTISDMTLVPGFPKQGNVIWQGFGGPCEQYNDGDPIVQYDQLADRWILTQFAVSATPYTQCIAVSTSGDPTGTFNRYSFSYSTNFNDYPKLGVWPDGYYMTYNIFKNGRTFGGSKVCVFERDVMLAGNPSPRQLCANTSTSYASLLPSDLEGTTLPPAGSPNFLLSIGTSTLQFWRYKVNWTAGTATLSGPTTVSGAASFSRACSGGTCIPQPSTTQKLDSLADRLMYRLSYRNFGDHESLLVNHSVATNSTSGIRWYELGNATGSTLAASAPTVRQQGTFSPDSNWRWMGTAAMDKTGGIAIGYNLSNATSIYPSLAYAFRAPTDTLGVLGSETPVLWSTGAQTGSLSRWGDYATMSIDPVDGCTMVFTAEYLPATGSFNWTTAIQTLKLASCQ